MLMQHAFIESNFRDQPLVGYIAPVALLEHVSQQPSSSLNTSSCLVLFCKCF
jgi:hypothetical protein